MKYNKEFEKKRNSAKKRQSTSSDVNEGCYENDNCKRKPICAIGFSLEDSGGGGGARGGWGHCA